MRRNKKYTTEFKDSAVALVLKENYSVKAAAERLGMIESTLMYWIRQHRKAQEPVKAAEERDLRERVAELERENHRLKLERDILKKATAFFAGEQA